MTATRTRSGNRCGHNPRAPRLRPLGRPPLDFLERTADRLAGYYQNPRVLPDVGGRRSERREALVLVASALVAHVDLCSLRVIDREPRAGDVEGLLRVKIRRRTGLSLWRIDRALADLHRSALLIHDGQPREQLDAERWRAHAARRRWSPRLWHALGMSAGLEDERRRAAARRRKRRERDQAAAGAGVRRALRPAARRFVAAGFPPVEVAAGDGMTPDQRRRFLEAQLRIRNAHPDLPAEEARELARAEVLGPAPPR